MSDKTIKHFIFSRFFSVQNPRYPYDVLDIDFLSKQLPLTKNIFRSLENQTNKDFELIFIVNDKFLTDPKYEFIFSTLKESTSLPLKFINIVSIRPLLKETHAKYDVVIQSRMDFDDFIYKDAVAETQAKVNECDRLLVYGYNRGYEYIYDELYPLFYSAGNENGHFSTFQSLILESSFVRKFRWGIQIWAFARHGQIKTQIKEFLENNAIEFSDNMFQQNNSQNAYIYFRHAFSLAQLITNAGSSKYKIPNRLPLTTKDITREQLKSEFGFDGYELKSIE